MNLRCPEVELLTTKWGAMLDGSGIYKVARQRAEEMLGSQVQHPFGPDWEVFKVRGKIFLLLTAVTGQQQRECLMVCVWVPNPHEEMDQNDYCGTTRSG